MSVAQRSPSAPMQISPGMTHPPSRLCPSDTRYSVPGKFRALTIWAVLPPCNASYPLPVRQASDLPSASPRFPVAQNTLVVQLTLPLAGRVKDFHLQVAAALPGTHKNGGRGRRFSLSRSLIRLVACGAWRPSRPDRCPARPGRQARERDWDWDWGPLRRAGRWRS